MDISFADKRLRGLYEATSAPKGFSPDVHKACCDKVRMIRHAHRRTRLAESEIVAL